MSKDQRILGTNMKRLLACVIARNAIPPGCGLIDGINYFKDKQRRIEVNRKSLNWIDQQIADIRSAPDNPYGDDEEIIAGGILDFVDEERGA